MRVLCWSIASFRPARRALVRAVVLAAAASGCTLITDIDREKIPDPPLPAFPEVDAGAQPGLDASTPPIIDAGLPGPDAASPDAADAGALDAGALDAGLDASSAS